MGLITNCDNISAMKFREVGKRIQMAREEKGLTQAELAARLGCTQSALSNYELGKRKPNLDLLNEIAEILNKPLDYFFEVVAANKDDSADSLRFPRL